jgi:hypothetical protein
MRRTANTALAALIAACAVLVLGATGAQAAITHPYLGSLGPEGSGAGAFGRVEGVAVEQSTQDVYVYDVSEGGKIYKFNSSGEPVDFSGLTGNVIEGVGGSGSAEEELAIDDSTGPAKGDIYAANNREVLIYSAAGTKRGSLSGGEMCGVAVDSAGHVYVGIYPATVKQYVPSASPVTNSDYVSSLSGLEGICNVAVDGEGDVYAATYTGGVRKYASSQFNTEDEPAVSIPAGVAFDANGRTLTVNRSAAVLYTDAETTISEYEDSGEPTLQGSFGAQLRESFGVAVNETSGGPDSGDLYAGSEGRVNIYGPATTVADVGLEPPATGVGQSSATVQGTVNPLGITVTACSFEYWVEQESEAASAACTPSPGSGNSPVSVSAALNGLAGNSTYNYRLAATDAHGASYSEIATFTTLPAAPVLTGAPTVSLVTRTSAVLAAGVDDQNSPGDVVVQFVAEAGYLPDAAEPYANGASSPSLQVSAGRGEQTVGPVPLTGLLAGTTYRYRVVVSSAGGTAFGVDQTFTTAAATPPLVSTGAASKVTHTGVLLSGSVGAEELQTSYEFEVGTDTSYGGAKLFGNAGASGTEAVSAGLQYLIPGTTYHYRLVATNEDGTTYGQDMTFTTPGYPSSITAPVSSPLLAVPAIAFPKVEPVTTRATTKTLTTKQRLQKALKVCQRDKNKYKRAGCEKQAQRKYGAVKKRKKA